MGLVQMPRRGENIYKRKDGRWEGRYINEYDISGKAKYKAVYAHSYSEVKRKLEEAKKSRIKNININLTNITVNDWFEYWLDRKVKNTIKQSTYAIYQRYINNHIQPFFKSIYLHKLNKDLIQKFVDDKNELSASTVQDIFLFFKSGIKAANKLGLVGTVWEEVLLPKATPPVFRVFSKTEQKMIEDAVKISDNPNSIGILICLYTGLRIGEVCALMWSDINFIGKTLTVQRTIQRICDKESSGTKIVISAPKSKHSNREIPLPEFLLDKLEKYKNEYGTSNGYVLQKNGLPIEPRTYQYQFERLLEKAKIKKAKFHTLRHTFSTRALEIGFDIKTLSEILGHANAAITLKQYAHSLDEHKRHSMELLGGIYN